jgi:hypothetical protein
MLYVLELNASMHAKGLLHFTPGSSSSLLELPSSMLELPASNLEFRRRVEIPAASWNPENTREFQGVGIPSLPRL